VQGNAIVVDWPTALFCKEILQIQQPVYVKPGESPKLLQPARSRSGTMVQRQAFAPAANLTLKE
jgi:hypothetical protein